MYNFIIYVMNDLKVTLFIVTATQCVSLFLLLQLKTYKCGRSVQTRFDKLTETSIYLPASPVNRYVQ